MIDASGTWGSPNPAGANGLPTVGESEATSKIAHGVPDVLGRDRARYSGTAVAVLGAGHSAIGTLTDLMKLARQAPGTTVIWLLRGNDPAKSFGGGANDKLAARGELGAQFASLVASGQVQVESGFRVAAVAMQDDRLRVATGSACCARQIIVVILASETTEIRVGRVGSAWCRLARHRRRAQSASRLRRHFGRDSHKGLT